jgi:FkbM family methyltransferase
MDHLQQMDKTLSSGTFAFGTFAPRGLIRWIVGVTRHLPLTRFGSGWAGRRIGYLLRRLALLRLGDRPVDILSFGVRFRLYPRNHVCEKRILFSPDDFDQVERDALAKRLAPDFTFIDIGAGVGGYSLAVAAMAAEQPGFTVRILALEPEPELFNRLACNISINPFGSIKALDLAVADREGELTLFLDPRNKGEASVKIVSIDQTRQVRVVARPLFALLKDEGFTRVDAMKLDVEGAEDLILDPFFAQAPTSLWPRFIILERGEARWGMDLLTLLANKGYVMRTQTRNNHMMERADDNA